MKIPLNKEKKEEEDEGYEINSQIFEINNIGNKDKDMKKILLISDKYLIEINLIDNNWKLVKHLSEGTF